MSLRPLLRPVLREPFRSPFVRGTGGFSPLRLFAAGEQGGWYDPSDFSTMFQDSAGTTPVTAVGQPVGKILDKSGRGNHLIQATAASRPILQQDGSGFYYLSFDGVDDGLASAATVNFTASQQLTFFAGVTKTGDSTFAALCELSALPTAAGSFSVQAPASSANYGFYAVGSSTSVTRTATPFAGPISNVLSCLYNTAGGVGANVSPRINAVVPTLTADANLGAAAFQNATVYVGRRGGTSNPFNGRLYQLVLRGATSSGTEVTNTERFVGSKMGIAL